MFSKVKNRILGVRWVLLAIMAGFENKFYAAADDRLIPPAFRYGREDGALINEGNMAGYGAMKNLIDDTRFGFNDSISGAKHVLRAFGRTTPQGDAVYAGMPIGSEFIVLTVDGNGLVTAAAKYLKVSTGANGWAITNNSITAPGSIIVASGFAAATNTTIQTITVAGITVGDLSFIQATTLGGGGACVWSNCNTAGFIVATMNAQATAGATLQYNVVRAVTA